MNYDEIKNRINQFKTNNCLDENVYNKIMNDLDELYRIKNNALLKLTSNEYILKEKEIFRIYVIGKLLNKALEEIKMKNYELALKYIKQMEPLNPSGNYLTRKDELESLCNFFYKYKERTKTN